MSMYTKASNEDANRSFTPEIGPVIEGPDGDSSPSSEGLTATITARVTPSEKDAFAERARQLNRPSSTLARAILMDAIDPARLPRVVPAINQAQWLELSAGVDLLDQAVRALDAGRTGALDEAVARASDDAAALVKVLRYFGNQIGKSPVDVREHVGPTFEAALQSARRLSHALHLQLSRRAEDLDPAAVEGARLAAEHCTALLADVRQLLLGGGEGP